MTDDDGSDLLQVYTTPHASSMELGPCVTLADARPWMIDFEKRSERREAYYIGLLSSITIAPGGKDTITLRFSGCDISLTGTQLGPLYDALLEQRVARIKEADPLSLGTPSTHPVVRTVEITPTR